MRISVTQQHIDNGVRGNCKKDALALAFIDAGFEDPWVGPTYVRSGNRKINLPQEALDFMDVFDNEPGASKPIEFILSE